MTAEFIFWYSLGLATFWGVWGMVAFAGVNPDGKSRVRVIAEIVVAGPVVWVFTVVAAAYKE